MFKITIEGASMTQLIANVSSVYDELFETETTKEVTIPVKPTKPATARKATKVQTPEPEAETIDVVAEDVSDDVDAELLAPVEPAPAGANVLVDAGTGRPAAETGAPAVTQMTFDDVKAAAAKLAAKDTPKLAALIKKYGGTNLSTVAKDKLGDFAGEVLEALG